MKKFFLFLAISWLMGLPLSAQRRGINVMELMERAEQGDTAAQYTLGYCYDRGLGLRTDLWIRKPLPRRRVPAAGPCCNPRESAETIGPSADRTQNP